jgi:replication factor C subunit 1
LWNRTVGKLKDEGKDSVQDVIDFMDSYYLTRDDFDAVLELGVGQLDMEGIKIETATKATFTRLYNTQNHPMPFVKASNVMGVAKAGGVKREKPDLEEAVDESDGEEALADAEPAEVDDDLDLKKDKYIKAPKKKAAAAGATAAKGKGKRKKADDDDSAVVSDDEPQKKRGSTGGGRGRGRGGGRGRGRGKA